MGVIGRVEWSGGAYIQNRKRREGGCTFWKIFYFLKSWKRMLRYVTVKGTGRSERRKLISNQFPLFSNFCLFLFRKSPEHYSHDERSRN